jgi:glutathione S-transferase
MRARLAIKSAGVTVELREIVLRDKAPELLAASPKGTVPVLVVNEGVIDESLDIMKWALAQNDPAGWLNIPKEGHALIAEADGPFKAALDRTKYASRHVGSDSMIEREKAALFLRKLDKMLIGESFLFGDRRSLADMAILPFVRQFAMTDKDWFDAQGWPALSQWLETFLTSGLFESVMRKYPKWQAGDPVTLFAECQT